MHPVGFEPTISAGELPKTYALDRAATGTGVISTSSHLKSIRGNPPYTHDQPSLLKISDNILYKGIQLIIYKCMNFRPCTGDRQQLFVFHPANYYEQLSEVIIHTEYYSYSVEFPGKQFVYYNH